jgi:hypothetical protein
VRVFYGPGGFTRAHRHAGSVTAYIAKGEIRSQLGGGPVETFKAGQSFFEPPGATHLVSANASNTEPAELIAVFVADEGAELTTFIEQNGAGWLSSPLPACGERSDCEAIRVRGTHRESQSVERPPPRPSPASGRGGEARFAAHTGFSVTRNPSRGFGIGHICQSGV